MRNILDLNENSNSDEIATTVFEYLTDSQHEKKSLALSFLKDYDDNVIIKSKSLAQTLINSKQTQDEFLKNKETLSLYHENTSKYLNTFYLLLVKFENESKNNPSSSEKDKKFLEQTCRLIQFKYLMLKSNHDQFKHFFSELPNFKPTFKSEKITSLRDKYNDVISNIKNKLK